MAVRNLLASLGKATTMNALLPRAATLVVALLLVVPTSAQPPLPPPRPLADTPDTKKDKDEQAEPGVQVAEKGPIHEAFAQPGAEVRGKGMTAPKAPPAPIPEVPPDTKPDGANVKWVGGYWHWDAEKEDFIWVSGFWRNFPSGRDWQAGKWTEKGGQWVYSPGFWRPVDMTSWRVDLPEPPRSVESGPSTPSDNPNAIWIPGAWEFRNERFVWRAGYWAQPNGNQVWQPGQYVQTTSGFTYCPGYWDYPLEERGLLYAPVYFTEPLWQTPGWCYRPRFAFGLGFGGFGGWGTGGLFTSLFIGSGFNHYCYGYPFSPWGFGGSWLGLGSPFYNPGFSIGFGLGFGSPFFGFNNCHPWWFKSKGFCNPLWNHYCWLNKGNPNWAGNVQAAQVARAVGAAPRRQALATANPGAGRPLPVAPPGVGGAIQTAARSAAVRSAPQPVIQPANQVATALRTARANPATGANAAPRVGGATGGAGNPAVRPGANTGVVTNPGAGRPLQVTPPVHSGAVQAKPGNAIKNPANVAGQPAARPAAVTQQPPGNPQIVPGRPDRPALQPPSGGSAIRPAGGTPPGKSNSQPVIRSGSLPINPPSGPAINPGKGPNLPAARPAPANPAPVIRSAPANPAPVIRSAPSAPVVRPSAPVVRPSAPVARPSAPAFRPSAPPAIRSAPINPGAGRGIPGGVRPPAGGGARPGGKR
jgi:hypothetical protein